MNGIELIAVERKRQVEAEGWTPQHDDAHDAGELAIAAACYATPKPIKMLKGVPCGCREASCNHTFGEIEKLMDPWPWEAEWDKRYKHDRLKQLAIAGALIAAEIDRILRGQKSNSSGAQPKK